MVVLTAARAATKGEVPLMLDVDEQLNPYQPNHRRMVPIVEMEISGMVGWHGWVGWARLEE
jgi:hypothetical protein